MQAQRSDSYSSGDDMSGSEYRLMPTTRDNTGNWHEYRRLVLNELQRLSSAQDATETERNTSGQTVARLEQALRTLQETVDETRSEIGQLKTGQASADTKIGRLDATTAAIAESVSEVKGKAAAISGTIGAAIAGLGALVKSLMGT